MKQCYILFRNHSEGIELRRQLSDRQITSTIAPTPRVLSSCCGISLLVKKKDLEEIRQCIQECGIEILDIAEIEKQFDSKRDQFC